MNYRYFSNESEERAATWRAAAIDHTPWQPSRDSKRDLETCGFVSIGDEHAYVKRAGRRHSLLSEEQGREGLAVEKIVSDMAYDLGVAAAPGSLWQPAPEQPDKIWFLSLNPFGQNATNTFSNFRSFVQESFNNAASGRAISADLLLQQAASQNTALWVFSVWTGDWPEHSGRPDNFLFALDKDNPERAAIASIDHADACLAFAKPQSTGVGQKDYAGPFNGRAQGYYRMREGIPAPAVDRDAARDMLDRIRNYGEENIREIVDRIPEVLLSNERKESIVSGLLNSKELTATFVEDFIAKIDKQNSLDLTVKQTAAPGHQATII